MEVKEIKGWKRASTDKEMQPIYKANLEDDLKTFSKKPLHTRDLVSFFNTSLRKSRYGRYIYLILIRNGTVTRYQVASGSIDFSIIRVDTLRKALSSIKRLPDSLFFFNTYDQGYCSSMHDCTVPVLSHFKSIGRQAMKDILMPVFNHPFGILYDFPWSRKTRKAMMRASMQSTMSSTCTRMTLYQLAQSDRQLKPLLDVGFTANRRHDLKLKLAKEISMPDHARWAWLISADGHTASARFGKLLGINSVTLKERSPHIEYYYRSARPGVHYVSFNQSNFKRVLLSLSKNDTIAQRISRAGQKFSYTYLHRSSKMLYARQVIIRYNALFGGEMKSLVKSLGSLKGMKMASEVMSVISKQLRDGAQKSG